MVDQDQDTVKEEKKEDIEKMVEQAASKDETAEVVSEQSDKPEELTIEEINWRKFRQEREQDRKAKEEAESAAKEKEAQVEALSQAVEQLLAGKGGRGELTKKEQEDIIDLIEDDIPTGGDVKKFLFKAVPDIVSKVIEERDRKEKEEAKQRERQMLPQLLRERHNDYAQYVNQDNLDYLDYHYPEISAALAALPESVDKWSKVYGAVKKLVPNSKDNESKRIDRNASKPQSVSAVQGYSQSNDPPSGYRINEAQKMENYRRLKELASS